MTVFRIAKERYIHDLSGEGARLYGGRWNPKGTSVLYTSENRALATVEFLVHLPMTLVPVDICMAEIRIPDDLRIDQIDTAVLPNNWQTHPPPLALAQLGRDWLEKNRTALLRVPSAVVDGEWNVLIDPRHPNAAGIAVATTYPVSFDRRLLNA